MYVPPLGPVKQVREVVVVIVGWSAEVGLVAVGNVMLPPVPAEIPVPVDVDVDAETVDLIELSPKPVLRAPSVAAMSSWALPSGNE